MKFFLLVVFLSTIAIQASSQTTTSIGIGTMLNHPTPSGYKFSYGRTLQANIRLKQNIALSPSVEHQKLKFTGTYNRLHVFDVFIIRLTGKYFFTNSLFADAGAVAYVGGENDVTLGGIAGTGSIGYQYPLSDRFFIEASLWSHFLNIDDIITPVIGVKGAIHFNFKHKKY